MKHCLYIFVTIFGGKTTGYHENKIIAYTTVMVIQVQTSLNKIFLTDRSFPQIREEKKYLTKISYLVALKLHYIFKFLYETGFAKNGLIAGVRNCNYSPFSLAKSIFVDFLFSSKIKKYDAFVIRSYNYILPGELSKG